MKHRKSGALDTLKPTELRRALQAVRVYAANVADGKLMQLLHERHGIRPLVPCTGAAHSNPHIDNCGVCMGGPWGWVENTNTDGLGRIDPNRDPVNG